MPNPFSPHNQVAGNPRPETVSVTDSYLVCESCYVIVTEGEWFEPKKELTFVCPNGHINIVKGMDL